MMVSLQDSAKTLWFNHRVLSNSRALPNMMVFVGNDAAVTLACLFPSCKSSWDNKPQPHIPKFSEVQKPYNKLNSNRIKCTSFGLPITNTFILFILFFSNLYPALPLKGSGQ